MSETAHTYHSGDGSLRHRIDQYLQTLKAYGNVRISIDFADDKEWFDTLGSGEDIVEAEKILKRSLALATDAINQNDLTLAKQQGFLSEKQAQEFSELKEKQEFARKLETKRQSESGNEYGQKQE